MADTKISALRAASLLTGDELVVGLQEGANCRITLAQKKEYINRAAELTLASGTTLTVVDHAGRFLRVTAANGAFPLAPAPADIQTIMGFNASGTTITVNELSFKPNAFFAFVSVDGRWHNKPTSAGGSGFGLTRTPMPGQWMWQNPLWTEVQGSSMSQESIYFAPFIMPKPIRPGELACRIRLATTLATGSTAAVVRLAIYANSDATWPPRPFGSPLAHTGMAGIDATSISEWSRTVATEQTAFIDEGTFCWSAFWVTGGAGAVQVSADSSNVPGQLSGNHASPSTPLSAGSSHSWRIGLPASTPSWPVAPETQVSSAGSRYGFMNMRAVLA